MPIDLNKFDSIITRTANNALRLASNEGALTLYENLEAGERSGIQYFFLPRQSSAAGEFPQEQSGDLRASIASWQIAPLKFGMGFKNNVPEYAIDIEYAPSDQGGRAPLALTFESVLTHARMMAGIWDNL